MVTIVMQGQVRAISILTTYVYPTVGLTIHKHPRTRAVLFSLDLECLVYFKRRLGTVVLVNILVAIPPLPALFVPFMCFSHELSINRQSMNIMRPCEVIHKGGGACNFNHIIYC